MEPFRCLLLWRYTRAKSRVDAKLGSDHMICVPLSSSWALVYFDRNETLFAL